MSMTVKNDRLFEYVVFLLYHDIDAEDQPSEKFETATLNTVVRYDDFFHHMNWLHSNEFQVMSVEKYFNVLKNGDFCKKMIVLTFDDGHISNYDKAFPVLKHFGFTATFYVVADRIGKPWHMNCAQLKEMVANGMEIGSHGLTHDYLPLIPFSDVRVELIKSKYILENCLKKKINSFAYPGGHYTKSIVNAVRKSGYQNAASCLLGTNKKEIKEEYLLKRVEIRRGVNVNEFQNALKPVNLLFYSAIDFIRRTLKLAVGLNNYGYLRKKFYKAYPFKR
jgi:peptidoglycan/xylan/chitin deacetylase (PgdA/CDA1 family)